MAEDVEGRPEERPTDRALGIVTPEVDADEAGIEMTAADSMRVWIAMQLSPNVEVCSSLLRGEYVSESALDAGWLDFAMHLRMIGLRDALDFFPNVVSGDRRAD
jgi:hypothetical protein